MFKLNDIQKIFEKALFKQLDRKSVKEGQIGDITQEVINEIVPEFVDTMIKSLQDNMDAVLEEHRQLDNGFVERNCKRWKEGFGYLRALIEICSEIGQSAIFTLKDDNEFKDSSKLGALTVLHSRALRTSNECLYLMQGGFPDAALARWRTLHELAVISQFLAKNDTIIAERYILSRKVEAYKAALQYVKYQDQANSEIISDQELKELKLQNDAVVKSCGKEITSAYGWAFPVIAKSRINLFDIEEFTGLDHWRPRVKWSAQEIHGAYVPVGAGLAYAESREALILIGRSNSGMTDPVHMVALSLQLVTASLVMLRPNFDTIIVLNIMTKFCDLVAENILIGEGKTQNDIM